MESPDTRSGEANAPMMRAGLSAEEAARRLAVDGPNAIRESRPPRLLSRVGPQLRDPMILLLLAAGVVTILLRDLSDTAVIAAVVVLNTGVGVVQELRAERAVAALRRLASPTARVIRDGADQVVEASTVVVGDLVRLDAGDVVPADADLTEAARLQCDESGLTGESVPVDKEAGEATYAGTVITRGRGVACVTLTGAASALGRIAELLADQPRRPTPLQQRLKSLSRILAIAAVALSGLVLVSGLIRGRSLGEMVVSAISLAVAAVPESLPAVVTLALALGAHRMAGRSAIVRALPGVETLGSVSILAADKTGTLTEGRMVVERLWCPIGRRAHGQEPDDEYRQEPSKEYGEEYALTGEGYEPRGQIFRRGDPMTDLPSEVTALLRDVALCNDADLAPPRGGEAVWRPVGDPMEAALLAVAGKAGVTAAHLQHDHPRVAERPFDSVRKRMTTIHPFRDGRWLVVCKGAPETMLGTPGLLAGTAPAGMRAARRRADELARDGYRVLAVGQALRSERPDPEHAEQGLDLVGLVAITDPPRDGAERVVQDFRDAGVRLLLITGDHPATAGAIAARIGVLDGLPGETPERSVRIGSDLEAGLDPNDLDSGRVYARTRPEQKLDIVKAWQARGHVVAMTGDGVNDGPALRCADIGVAMGRGGTEVARQAADLVLADDNLRTVVAAIEEGRRIFANVRRFLRYALSGGLAEVLVMLLGPFVGLTVPLLPAQILWINMLTHGLPGVALGAEPADPQAMRHPPRPPREFILGGGLGRHIALSGAAIAAVSIGIGMWAQATGRPWQSLIFLVLGLAQLGLAPALHRGGPGTNRFLAVTVAIAVLLQFTALYLEPLRAVLGTRPVAPSDVAVAVAAATVPGLLLVFARAAGHARNARRSHRAGAGHGGTR